MLPAVLGAGWAQALGAGIGRGRWALAGRGRWVVRALGWARALGGAGAWLGAGAGRWAGCWLGWPGWPGWPGRSLAGLAGSGSGRALVGRCKPIRGQYSAGHPRVASSMCCTCQCTLLWALGALRAGRAGRCEPIRGQFYFFHPIRGQCYLMRWALGGAGA